MLGGRARRLKPRRKDKALGAKLLGASLQGPGRESTSWQTLGWKPRRGKSSGIATAWVHLGHWESYWDSLVPRR
jgi:hypothetical protein